MPTYLNIFAINDSNWLPFLQAYQDGHGAGHFLTASVPAGPGSPDRYIRKLVNAGHKVGVVSQTETAAQKKVGKTLNESGESDVTTGSSKAPFDRQLTSVYTASTLLLGGIGGSSGDLNFDGGRDGWVISIVCHEDVLALAACRSGQKSLLGLFFHLLIERLACSFRQTFLSM